MWGSRFASLAVHAGLIALAIRFSGGAEAAAPYTTIDTIIFVEPAPATRPAAPPVWGGTVPPRPVPVVSSEVPTTIPPIGDSLPWTDVPPGPDTPGGFGSDTLHLTGGQPLVAAPMAALVADEAPRLLSHPPPRYPEMLRRAGIEGRVVIEAVLDTAGRVENGSLRAIEGGASLFEAEARAVVLGSRYAAARHGGRAVRVRILVPVAFSLRR